MRQNKKWILLLAATAALFSWRIFFTGQFTISEDWEAANQGYAYYQFMVSSVHKGFAPFWDPYTFSGRTFIGDMQAGVFYPLKLFFYLWPLGPSGILSNRLFMQYHVLVRFLAAVFMFLLARELGLKNRIAAFVSAICFGLGGFVGNVGGLILLDSAVWLPLIFLFLLRALRSVETKWSLCYAMLSGLCLGMPVLAGGLHIPLMDVVVVISASIFLALQTSTEMASRTGVRERLWWTARVVAIVGVISFASSAVQLFPAMELAPLSIHWSAQVPTLAKTPYANITYVLWPRSLFTFLFGAAPFGFEFSPYLGVLPLVLALIGAWVYRERPWVKYLSWLAGLVFFYSLGPFSFLHGLAYLLVPFLDKAHESDRFLYLVHFALALLAGFGVEALWTSGSDPEGFSPRLMGSLRWGVIALFLALGLPTLYGKPDVNEWYYVSFLFVLASWGILTYILRGHRNWKAAALLVAIILSDLYAFHWGDLNRMAAQKQGKDYLEQLLAGREMADFFKSQPGLFRVDMDADGTDFLNLGEMFDVQITRGISGATLLDYTPFFQFPKGLDLLNVRYIAAAGKDLPGQPVYTQGRYKVYENTTACPRAWMVRRVDQEHVLQKIIDGIQQPGFDLRTEAFVDEPIHLESAAADSAADSIDFGGYQNNQFDLTAHAGAPGLLVVSEMYYPGWGATVNGKPVHIYKVDGILRGIVLPAGESRIEFRYRPKSVLYGALLSGLTLPVVLVFAGFVFFGNKQEPA